MIVRIKGVQQVENMIFKKSKSINKKSKDVVKQVANLGLRMARLLTPHGKGHTRLAILNFKRGKESWVIVSSPPRDHPGFPLNVYLDTGNVSALNWGTRTSPKTGQFGAMIRTESFLEKEFSRRLNLEIKRIVR